MKKLDKPQSIRSVVVLVAIFVFASTPCFSAPTYLWAADYNLGTVYKHDATGALILKWETDFFGHPTGIAFDGTNLLIGDSFEAYNRIYKYSRQGVQLSYIDLDTVGLSKIRSFEKKVLAWDGEFLWYSSSARFEVYKIKINAWAPSAGSIEIVASFPVPGSSPTGLEWDGRSLWLVDNLNNFYQIDPSGNVLSSFGYSREVTDLAWDGQFLWAHGGGFDGGTFKLDQWGNTLSELDIYYWPGSGAAWEFVAPPGGDTTRPTVTSIIRWSPASQTNNVQFVTWLVNFSEQVTGMDVNDFTLTDVTGTINGEFLTSVSAGGGSQVQVTANTGSGGAGDLRLDVNYPTATITDLAANAFTNSFTSGQVYTVDKVPPTVVSINRYNSVEQTTSATSVIYRVTFSEPVMGVATDDFTLVDVSGAITGESITSVSASSGTTIDVMASTGSIGDGNLRLDVIAPGATIIDTAANPLVASYTDGEIYSVFRTMVYYATDLGVLPNRAQSVASAVNESGQVAGYSRASDGINHHRASLYSEGILYNLGLPSGTPVFDTMESRAYAINEAGTVVGYADVVGGSHAFVYENGENRDLGTFLGGNYSFATGINDDGVIVGYANDASNAHFAFRYENGVMENLGTLPGRRADAYGSIAYDVNNHGQIVGASGTASYYAHAILYDNGVMQDLGTVFGPGVNSDAMSINDLGQVAGYWGNATVGYRGFLYSEGEMHDLGMLPGGSDVIARSINATGWIVGSAKDAQGNQRAFLFDGTSIMDLNTLLAPDDASNWVLTGASDINDARQIVGTGVHDGQVRGFLLSPVITPPTGEKPAIDVPWESTVSALKQNSATAGWEFIVSSPIKVTKLGLFDFGQDGFAESHRSGIWTTNGVLLVQTEFANGTGAELMDGFRYLPVPETILQSGHYVIGAYFGDSGPDRILDSPALATLAPQIAFHQPRYGEGEELSFPNIGQGVGNGTNHFGPNFLFVEAGPAIAVTLTSTNLLLKWATTSHAFRLEATASLSPPNNWQAVTNLPSIIDSRYELTLPRTSGNRFFRLANP